METPSRQGENPSVVFIAQLGTGGDSWKPIVDRLPGVATFAYDRPGTGEAPARPAPNPPIPHSVFARELADLLEREGLTEPAIVVGHSFGGNIARVYAGMCPERIAGLIFVDSSIPQTFLLPGDQAAADGDSPDATMVDRTTGQVEILSALIPDVPTVALTRTPGRWDGENPPPHPAVEDLWLVSQRILARDFRAPLIVANDSGHQIPREAPDLTVYAIQAVRDAARSGKPVELDGEELERLGGHLDR